MCEALNVLKNNSKSFSSKFFEKKHSKLFDHESFEKTFQKFLQ